MTRPRHNSAGFTLAELVVAIAILGVGMTMAAALFPAAMKQLEYSMRDITGTVICQRGLDVARTVLDPNGSDIPALDLSSPATSIKSWFVADPTRNTRLNGVQYYDPHQEGRTNKGFVLLARKVSANPSDGYMMLAAAYWRKVSTGTIAATGLSGDLINPQVDPCSTAVKNGAGRLQVGSPFIDAVTGQFAIITAVSPDQNTGTLDRPINNLAGGRATPPFTAATLTDGNRTQPWPANMTSCAVVVVSGTGAGQSRPISSVAGNTLNLGGPAWGTVPDSTSYYTICGPCTSALVVWQSNVQQDSPVIGTMQRTVQLR